MVYQECSWTTILLLISILIGLCKGWCRVDKECYLWNQGVYSARIHSGLFYYIYFVFPTIGLTLTYIASKLILGQLTGQGISDTLYAIEENGKMGLRGTYSPLIAPLTVGFWRFCGAWGSNRIYGSSIFNLRTALPLESETVNLMIDVQQLAPWLPYFMHRLAHHICYRNIFFDLNAICQYCTDAFSLFNRAR